ncbi:unnamed protein product [Aphanomyces euteiches]
MKKVLILSQSFVDTFKFQIADQKASMGREQTTAKARMSERPPLTKIYQRGASVTQIRPRNPEVRVESTANEPIEIDDDSSDEDGSAEKSPIKPAKKVKVVKPALTTKGKVKKASKSKPSLDSKPSEMPKVREQSPKREPILHGKPTETPSVKEKSQEIVQTITPSKSNDEKPRKSNVDKEKIKAMVILRTRATVAFIRYLRSKGHQTGDTNSLLSQFFLEQPKFRASQLNEERLGRYSKGILSMKNGKLSVHALKNIPFRTISLRQVHEKNISYTLGFCLRFCHFVVSNYPSGCDLAPAIEAFCDQFGIRWQDVIVLKSLLAFYCSRILQLNDKHAQTELTVCHGAEQEILRLVSLLLVVWLKQEYRQCKAPWIQALNQFRHKYHMPKMKLNHYSLMAFPWLNNFKMNKSAVVWTVEWEASKVPPSLLSLYVEHIQPQMTPNSQVPYIEANSLIFLEPIDDGGENLKQKTEEHYLHRQSTGPQSTNVLVENSTLKAPITNTALPAQESMKSIPTTITNKPAKKAERTKPEDPEKTDANKRQRVQQSPQKDAVFKYISFISLANSVQDI